MASVLGQRNRLLLRLSLPVFVISVLLLALGVGGAVYVQRLQKSASRRMARQVAGVLAAEQLEIVLRETRTQLNQYLLGGDVESLDKAVALRIERDHWIDDAEKLADTGEERMLLAAIRRGTAEFDESLQQIMLENGEDPSREDLRTLAGTVFPYSVLVPSQSLLDMNETQIEASSHENERLADRLSYGLLIVGTLGAVGGVVGGYGMARAVGRSIVQLSLPIRDVAGKLDHLAGTMTVVADPGLENLESVLREISRRVSGVIEQLHRSQKEALRAEQLAGVGQLAAGLAHELRNPLMSMKILIQSAALSNQAMPLDRDDLLVLNQEVTRLEELVETFLNFARPPQPEKKPVVLQDLIRKTLLSVGRRAQARDVVVRDELPAAELTIVADGGQIRQVLVNLLVNALEAVSKGGEVVVLAERHRGSSLAMPLGRTAGKGAGGWVEIHVIDNGRGLPKDLGDRIFEPFVTTSEAGMGLGLSICKRIVETHGGTISAANRVGGGALFTVRLPLEKHTTEKAQAHAAIAGN